eukprot:13095865-Ditylum_brightwellii.AAC.1
MQTTLKDKNIHVQNTKEDTTSTAQENSDVDSDSDSNSTEKNKTITSSLCKSCRKAKLDPSFRTRSNQRKGNFSLDLIQEKDWEETRYDLNVEIQEDR